MRKRIYGGEALPIEAGVISNHTYVFATQRGEAFRLQHVEASQHPCRTGMPLSLCVRNIRIGRTAGLRCQSIATNHQHRKKSQRASLWRFTSNGAHGCHRLPHKSQ
jgi:hypothetical protein